MLAATSQLHRSTPDPNKKINSQDAATNPATAPNPWFRNEEFLNKIINILLPASAIIIATGLTLFCVLQANLLPTGLTISLGVISGLLGGLGSFLIIKPYGPSFSLPLKTKFTASALIAFAGICGGLAAAAGKGLFGANSHILFPCILVAALFTLGASIVTGLYKNLCTAKEEPAPVAIQTMKKERKMLAEELLPNEREGIRCLSLCAQKDKQDILIERYYVKMQHNNQDDRSSYYNFYKNKADGRVIIIVDATHCIRLPKDTKISEYGLGIEIEGKTIYSSNYGTEDCSINTLSHRVIKHIRYGRIDEAAESSRPSIKSAPEEKSHIDEAAQNSYALVNPNPEKQNFEVSLIVSIKELSQPPLKA